MGLLDHVLLVSATTPSGRFERVLPTIGGAPLAVGRSLGLPVGEGKPLARIQWSGAHTGVVTERDGSRKTLEPNSPVSIVSEGLRVDLLVIRRFWLRPFGATSWAVSIAWSAVATALFVGLGTFNDAYGLRCDVYQTVGVYHPIGLEWYAKDAGCNPPSADGGGLPMDVAEYLKRLLQEDYAGDAEWQEITEKPEIPEKTKWYYLPAGNKGPTTEFGGAEETAPEPVRTAEEQNSSSEAPPPVIALGANPDDKKVEPQPDQTPREIGQDGTQDDGISDAEEPDTDEESTDPPAEEQQGFGIQDWYDAADQNQERVEIEQQLRAAKGRLKIDPDDPSALMVLSYYQYLSEDFDGATATYDKYLSLYPEDSAGYNNKALVYKRQGRYVEEEALYRQALSLQPLDPIPMENLALNLAHQQRYDEALQIMDQLAVLDPSDPYGDLHRAKIYAQMGNDAEALAFLEKALEGMKELDTLHSIEFRQDIRVDPSFESLRKTPAFHDLMVKYYGKDAPVH